MIKSNSNSKIKPKPKPKPKYPVGTRVKSIEHFRNDEIGYVDKIKENMVLGEFAGYKYYVKFRDGEVPTFFEENIVAEPYTGHLRKSYLHRPDLHKPYSHKPDKHYVEHAANSKKYATDKIKDLSSIPTADRLKRMDEVQIDKIKEIGATLTAFTEADINTIDFYIENTDKYACFLAGKPSSIREVHHKDVTSNHFVRWFFALENWVYCSPKDFNFDLIVHNDVFSVYGYFSGSDLSNRNNLYSAGNNRSDNAIHTDKNSDKLDGLFRIDDYDDYYSLSFFCINPSLQGQGIGQHLLQYVINTFADKSMELCVRKDNKAAIHIYQKFGFEIIGSGQDRGFGGRSKTLIENYVMWRDVG